jgi:hypothetical protein
MCRSSLRESLPKSLPGRERHPRSAARCACYAETMSVKLQILYRVAAVLMLLLTGAELVACEMIAPDRCESFGFPADNPNSTGDDNCICCCTHILIAEPVSLKACAEVVAIAEYPALAPPESEPPSIYHPPRA